MERKSVVALLFVLGIASAAVAQDKAAGPYGLPTFAAFKDAVKPTDDEAKKVEEIYATAAKNETESKARAKENGTDRKAQEGYATISRNETINKIKEVLDKDKATAFDKLCSASVPDKKKKK